jgi:Leucine-rich repeat (LRR) protein
MVSYISQNEDYWIAKDEGYGNALILKTPWSSRYLGIIADYQVRIIRLNERIGWPDSDISFLLEVPEIFGVDILSDKVTDVSPIFHLKNLKTLSLFCRTKIAGDFGKLGNLRSVGLSWRPAYESLFSSNFLQQINVLDFPDKNLGKWKSNEELCVLRLESNELENLIGLERFPNITELRLFKCPKLKTLDAIKSAKFIQKLSIARCPNFRNLSPVAHLSRLTDLEIEDCREIESLKPVAKCKKLQLLQIAGNTTVIDGDFTDLSKLPSLKRVLLAERKHYSHKGSQLEK